MKEQSDLHKFAEVILNMPMPKKKKTDICGCCGCAILPKFQYCDDCMEEKVPRLETWGPDTYDEAELL